METPNITKTTTFPRASISTAANCYGRTNSTTTSDRTTEFGINRERIRQIEVPAFDKLRRSTPKQAIDDKLIGEFA